MTDTKPIDPNDMTGVLTAYNAAASGDESLGSSVAVQTLMGIRAVARAVLPEGYVAVPVADVQEMLSQLAWYLGPEHDEWYQRIRSLLPTESEVTR